MIKSLAKAMANGICLTLVFPAFLCYRLSALIAGPGRAFPGWSQCFSLIPGITGVYLRRAFYSLVLPHCPLNCWIGFGTIFSYSTAKVGNHAYIGPFGCLGDVTLGDDVLLGSHVSIMNGKEQHGTKRLDIPMREQPGKWQHITIGCDTWIGDRALILADVGSHCVIGAGSIVTKPIPDYAVAIGAPAKVIRYRNEEEPQKMPIPVESTT